MSVTDFCRLCLINIAGENDVYSVFQKSSFDSDNQTLAEIALCLFGIKIKETDNYSHFVCKRCHQKLIVCFQYRDTFQKNQIILEKRYYEHTHPALRCSNPDEDVIVIDPDPQDTTNIYSPIKSAICDTITLDDEISLIPKFPCLKRKSISAQKEIVKEEDDDVCIIEETPNYIKIPLEYLSYTCPFVELDNFDDLYKTYTQINQKTFKIKSPSPVKIDKVKTDSPQSNFSEALNDICTVTSISVLVCDFCSRSFKSQALLDFHYRKVHFKKRKRKYIVPKSIGANVAQVARKSTTSDNSGKVANKTGRLFNKIKTKYFILKQNVKKNQSDEEAKDSGPEKTTDTDTPTIPKRRRGRPFKGTTKIKKISILIKDNNFQVIKRRRGRPKKIICNENSITDSCSNKSQENADKLSANRPNYSSTRRKPLENNTVSNTDEKLDTDVIQKRNSSTRGSLKKTQISNKVQDDPSTTKPLKRRGRSSKNNVIVKEHEHKTITKPLETLDKLLKRDSITTDTLPKKPKAFLFAKKEDLSMVVVKKKRGRRRKNRSLDTKADPDPKPIEQPVNRSRSLRKSTKFSRMVSEKLEFLRNNFNLSPSSDLLDTAHMPNIVENPDFLTREPKLLTNSPTDVGVNTDVQNNSGITNKSITKTNSKSSVGGNEIILNLKGKSESKLSCRELDEIIDLT